MSSTFLTRLRLGEILVDAKGVSRLYRPRPGHGAAAAACSLAGLIALDRGRARDARPARRRRPALAEAAGPARRRRAERPLAARRMFDFRYHALSLVAVFVALVVGLLLGVAIGDAGLVSSGRAETCATSLREDVQQGAQRRSATPSAQVAGARARYENAAYPLLVGGRLDGPARIGLHRARRACRERRPRRARRRSRAPGATADARTVDRRASRSTSTALAQRAAGTRYAALVERPGPAASTSARRIGHPAACRAATLLARVRRDAALVLRAASSTGRRRASSSCAATPKLDADDKQAADRGVRERPRSRGLARDDVPVVGVETTATEPSQVGWYRDHELSSVDNLDELAGQAALVFALAGASGSFGAKPTADARCRRRSRDDLLPRRPSRRSARASLRSRAVQALPAIARRCSSPLLVDSGGAAHRCVDGGLACARTTAAARSAVPGRVRRRSRRASSRCVILAAAGRARGRRRLPPGARHGGRLRARRRASSGWSTTRCGRRPRAAGAATAPRCCGARFSTGALKAVGSLGLALLRAGAATAGRRALPARRRGARPGDEPLQPARPAARARAARPSSLLGAGADARRAGTPGRCWTLGLFVGADPRRRRSTTCASAAMLGDTGSNVDRRRSPGCGSCSRSATTGLAIAARRPARHHRLRGVPLDLRAGRTGSACCVT